MGAEVGLGSHRDLGLQGGARRGRARAKSPSESLLGAFLARFAPEVSWVARPR